MDEFPILGALLLALACVSASPLGTSTYTAQFGPKPRNSIAADGSTLIVRDFEADRAFTTTISRYNIKTLELLSATQDGNCCATAWKSIITRNSRGSYTIVTKKSMAPPGHEPVQSSIHFQSENFPVIVNGFALIPWIYHITHTQKIERLSLPGPSVNDFTVEMLDVIADAELTRPAGVPSLDNALRVQHSDKVTTLWYDPCTFTLDAVQTGSSVVRRTGP